MPELILVILAAFCAAYYIVIAIYAGAATSFAWIWLVLTAFLLFLAYGKRYYARNRERVPLWLPVSVITTGVAGVAVFAAVSIMVFLGVASADTPNLDYLIVLGTQVRDGSDSNSFENRLDKAIRYQMENPETVLVLSGGRTKGDSQAQAEIMYSYLAAHGVNPSRVLLETRSQSTVENIAYSKLAIEADRRERKAAAAGRTPRPVLDVPVTVVPDKPVQIGILTSDFHVYRAVMIAKKWGIENPKGIGSDSDSVLFLHLCVRECAAVIKDRIVGNM